MKGYDAWLEAPYVNAAREEAAFEEWCEREDVDPDAPDAWDRFEDAQYDAQEAAAEEAAERRADAERDDW